MADPIQRNNTYRLLQFVSRQPLSVTRWLAKMLAGLLGILKNVKTAKTITTNLKIALPEIGEAERQAITKQAMRNELTSYLEFFSIWGADQATNIKRVHQVHGEHLIHEALAAKQGIVLVVPHFGTWEIMNAWIAQYTQMTIMYKPVKDPGADAFVRQSRSREHANLVPTDESGVRQIFKALKQGGTTVILPDHTPDLHGSEMVPYFGVPLYSSNLSAKLIQKTKAKALLLYAMRNDQHGFDMYIEAIDEAIYSSTPHQGTQIIHQALEGLIQRYPAHYHWSYKRFKAHPDLRGLYNLSDEDALKRVAQVRQARFSG